MGSTRRAPSTLQLQALRPLIEDAIQRGEAEADRRTARSSQRPASTPAVRRRTSSSCATKTPKPSSGGTTTSRWTSTQFDALHAEFLAHAADKDLFVQDLIGGADRSLCLPVRVVTEYAWHSLFIRNLLIRPRRPSLPPSCPKMTIIDLPSFRADPERHGTRSETVIAIDLTRMIVLIGGTAYAGEMKKSVFTALNYLLPSKGVMPMHCSANVGPDGDAASSSACRAPARRRCRRPGPHADRRRRAWLGPGRHLQLRRRLLRQDASGCRRKPSRKSIAASSVSAPCSKTSCWRRQRAFPISTTARRPKTPAAAYPLDFIPNASPPAAPASRRTSSC
jgi:phosphoenolpyruvate carboxykinase (ATP)